MRGAIGKDDDKPSERLRSALARFGFRAGPVQRGPFIQPGLSGPAGVLQGQSELGTIHVALDLKYQHPTGGIEPENAWSGPTPAPSLA